MANPVRLDPFQRIINVSWGTSGILVLIASAFVGRISASPPSIKDYIIDIHIGGRSENILINKMIVPRSGAIGPAPTISTLVTPAMKAYYAIWAYEPYKNASPVGHSSGGGFWFITPVDIGVFPDFVPSPYGSIEEAEAYLDAQAIIHPEYFGHTFQIDFFPHFDEYSQTVEWRQMTFINLAAFPKNSFGNIEIAFRAHSDEDISGSNLGVNLSAFLFRDPPPLNFPVNADNTPQFFSWPFPPFAAYSLDLTESSGADFPGTLIVHPANPPSITGPASPGGGGGEG